MTRKVVFSIASLIAIVACSSTPMSRDERVSSASQAETTPDDSSSAVDPSRPKDTKCDFGCTDERQGNRPNGVPTLPPTPPPPPPEDTGGIHGGASEPPKPPPDTFGGDTPPPDEANTGSGGLAGNGDNPTDRPNKPGKGNKPEKGGEPKPEDTERPRPCSVAAWDDPETGCIDTSRYCILNEPALWAACWQEYRDTPESMVSACYYTCYYKDGHTTVEKEITPCEHTYDGWRPACGDVLKHPHPW